MRELKNVPNSDKSHALDLAEIEQLFRQFEDAVYKEGFYTGNNDPLGRKFASKPKTPS